MKIGIKDRELVKTSFRVMCSGMLNVDLQDFINKDLYYNIFSTAPGDNRYVNPLAGYSPAADPRYPQLMVDNTSGGMGAQFKRIIDDNVSTVTFTVGVPEFSGLLSFILTMFDPISAVAANKGRAPSLTFYLGQLVGSVVAAPLQLVNIGLMFLNWLIGTPRNQYYYLKPVNAMYIQSANGFLNDLMVGMGYIKPLLESNNNDVAPIGGIGDSFKDNYKNELHRLAELFPEVYNKNGTIDLMRLVGRGTRKYRYMLKILSDLDTTLSDEEIQRITNADVKSEVIENAIRKAASSVGLHTAAIGQPTTDYLKKELDTTAKTRDGNESDYPEESSAYLSQDKFDNLHTTDVTATDKDGHVVNDFAPLSSGGVSNSDLNTKTESIAMKTDAEGNKVPVGKNKIVYTDNKNSESWLGSIGDLLETAFHGGFDSITWRCEHNGTVTDSFSNNSVASPLADKFNSTTKAINTTKFDLAGGKLGIPIVDHVIEMATDAVKGVASSLQIANIPMALAGNAYVNIPDHWESSSANIHKESYKFYFEATYAHPYSQITGIWIFFALLAPLFIPNAAGPSMYTAPFMLKAFSKSRQIIRLGMVDSATITIGDGPGGWTRDRKPLNMTVELSIADMEKFVNIPIVRTNPLLNTLTNIPSGVSSLLTDIGKYNEYVSRLTGQDYLDTVLRWNRLSRRLTTMSLEAQRTFSSSNVASWVSDSVVGGLGQIFTRQINR